MRTLRVVLVLLLLGTLAAVAGSGGAPRHEHGSSESGEHQHEHGHGRPGPWSQSPVHQHHGHGHVHGRARTSIRTFPSRWRDRAYLSALRDSTQPGRIAWQAGLSLWWMRPVGLAVEAVVAMKGWRLGLLLVLLSLLAGSTSAPIGMIASSVRLRRADPTDVFLDLLVKCELLPPE